MNFTRIQFAFFFILSLGLFSSCDDETGDMQPQTTFLINESIREWTSPYEAVDQEFSYSNSDNEEAIITVIVKLDATESSFIDCQRNGNTVQCEYESIALEFASESDTLMHLTAVLFGEDRMTLNYDKQGGLTPEIIRYQEEGFEFENPQSDNFEVTFEESYTYNGTTNNAFIVNTTSLEGLFSTTPPNSFIFVKGIGIIEWTDYRGETWVLND